MNQPLFKGHCEYRSKITGLEKLIKAIFYEKSYNELVRPVNNDGVTVVETELKLLQIDLVK